MRETKKDEWMRGKRKRVYALPDPSFLHLYMGIGLWPQAEEDGHVLKYAAERRKTT